MKESEFIEFCSTYEFTKYADITFNDKHACFSNLNTNYTVSGCVYIWLETSGDSFNIVYAGMAGKTMKKRCGEHAQGFKGESTGKAHSKRISKGISQNKIYAVYARQSGETTILHETDISLCYSEESALIKKLKPAWNKLKT